MAEQNEVDFAKKTKELIEFFRENASGAVSRVTKEMAKYKALKLLEEVGISSLESVIVSTHLSSQAV